MALPRYLAAEDVKEILGCSYGKALKAMREAGSIKVGALVRVREDKLYAHLERRCPDRASRRTSSEEKGDEASTPIFRETSPTSASEPKTKRKRRPPLPNCSTLADYDRLLAKLKVR